MKKISLLLLSLVFVACSTKPCNCDDKNGNATYVSGDLTPALKTQISDFPSLKSPEEKSDVAELKHLQKTRTKADCDRAASEVVVSLQSTYGLPYGVLNEKQVTTLDPFFQKIRDQLGGYIGKIKKNYSRPRPYDYIKGLTPCVAKEDSFAYPSGHSTIANLYALVLKDLFPDKAEAVQARATQIAHDRVLAGLHHPTDIAAGKKLGELLYAELSKSKLYQDDVLKYRSLVMASEAH